MRDAHDIKARSYADRLYVELHVVVDPEITVSQGHSIAKEVRRRVRDVIPDVLDLIVHVDPDEGEDAKPTI